MGKKIPQILIVDDDPNLTGSMSDILRAKGFEPLIALTGAAALQSIDQHQIEVVIIDLRLGDMSGSEVLRGIKSRSPETECIFLTGHASQSSAIEAVQLGAFGFFLKPFEVEQLLLSIQRAVEKNQSARALRDSEQRFHALIQNAADLIVVINSEGVILYASPSSERIMGYRPREFIGKKFHKLVHPEDLRLAVESLASRREIAGTADDTIEIRCLHKNGAWRVIEVLGTNLLAEPSVKGIVMNIRDVTERKQAEEELRRNEERFRALIEHSADAISLLDADGVMIYEGPAAKRIMKFQSDDRVGANIFDHLDPVNLQSHKELFEKVLKQPNLPFDSVFRYSHRDGSFSWAEATITNLLDEPAVNAIVVNYRDITGRKLAEEALHKSEQRYRGLFEDTPIAIWEEDFSEIKEHLDSLKQQGITDFRKYFVLHPDVVFEYSAMIKVLNVNNSAVQMFEAESKEVLIKHTNSGLSKGESEHNYEDFLAIAEGKTSNSWEGSDETLSGKPIEIALSWSVAPGYEDDFSKVIVTTLDITERKLAEEALRKNDELLSEAQRIGKIGHWEWSAPGEFLICSDEFFNILEIPRDGRQVSQKTIAKMVHPEDLKQLKKMDAEIFSQHSDIDYEYRIILTGERVRWIHQQAKVYFGEDGQPVRMMGILQDVTDSKLAEEALRRNEERYRLLFDSAPVGIFSATPQGQIVEINPIALQILGSPSIEATKAINLLTFPRLVETGFSSNFQRCVQTGQPVFAEQSYTSQWGKSVYAQYRLTPISDASEKITLVQVILEDITERKQFEEQLLLQSSALNAAANAIVLTNVEGAIKWANPAFTQLTGYTLEESFGKNPRELVRSGEQDKPFYKHMWDTILSGNVWHGEIVNRRKDESHYQEELTITPLKDADGTVRHFIAVKQDITERKLAEEKTRQQAEQLQLLYEAGQRLNRTLDLDHIYQAVCDFMSGIAPNDGLFISAFDPETQLITCRAYWMENKWLDVSPFPAIPLEEEGKGTQSRVIRSGQPLLINDYQAYLKTTEIVYYVDSETNEIGKEIPPDEDVTRSALIVPLKVGDVVNGVIQVVSYRLNAYTESQLKLLEALALHIASAERNALLYAQVQAELTERKQAEDRFKTVFEQSPLGISLVDSLTGHIYAVNPRFAEIAGRSMAEMANIDWMQITHPDDVQADFDNMALLNDGKINGFKMEKRYLHPDGTAVWINMTIAPLRIKDNALPRHLCMIEDITERRRAEEQLRLQDSALNAAASSIFITDTDGIIKWVNPAYSKLSGYALEEAVEKNPRDLVKSGEHDSAFYKNMWDTILSGQVWQGELVNRRKDGSHYTEELTITPLKDMNGRISHFIAIEQDISERKLVEEALREREEQYRTLVEQLPAIVFIDDVNDEGRTLYVSPQIETILGFTPQEWQEESPGLWSKQVHPDDVERVHANYMRCFQYGEPYEAEYRIRASDGRPLWFHDQAVMLRNENGLPHLIHGVMYDITERKQAEESLRESEKRYHDLFEDSPIALVEEDFSVVKQRLDTLRKEGVTDFHEYLANHPEVVIECAKMVMIKDVNKAALKMYRADGKNKMPKDLSEILGADALENFINQLANIANGQVMFNWEGINHAIDGSQIDVEVNWSAAGYEKDLSKVIVSLQDITARKQAEEILRSKERSLREAQVIAGLGNYVFDIQAGMWTSSEVLDLIFGIDEKYIRSVDGWLALIHPDFRPGMSDYLSKEILENHALFDREYKIVRKSDGLERWVHGLGELDIDGQNRLVKLHGTIQDITEHKQTEEAIRQRVTELELLYESGLALSQLLSPKDIGNKIMELLERKMDWHHTAIRLYDSETNMLRLLAFNQPGLVSVEEKTAMEEQVRGSVTRIDRGLSGWVVQHGQIVRTDDLENDERYFETLPGMKSGLYVPIKLGNHVIGAISIESEKPGAFSEADERLTNTLANQAASALENARLFDETAQRIKELSALHRTGQQLLAARLNSEEIYAAVHKTVAETMPCDAFVIVMNDEDQGDYHAVYFFDKGERFPERRLPRGSGLSGRVISSGETLLIDDTAVTNVPATHFGSMESTRSILAVPLHRGNEVIGMLSAQSYQPHVFGEAQRVLLETITAQLSAALDNTHLYQQTQDRIKELETLYIISTSLRTVQYTDEALSILMDKTLATLETDSGSILLYDSPSNELHHVVARGWFTKLAAIPVKVGRGIAGTVFASGEPYYSDEFSSDALVNASARDKIPAGWGGVCLPIRTSTEIIGVSFVSIQQPRQINSQQVRLLESLVDMAGAALHRMRLYNETARRAEEFASLYEMSKALSDEYDLNSLLKVIVNRTMEMLKASTSGMYLYHAESQELELMMDTSPTIPIGSRLQLGEGVAGKVAETRLPLRLDSYSTWEGRSPQFLNVPIGAVIEVPMLYAGELIGVLTADEAVDSSRKFTEADERLLSLFASQAAGAINAARHREDTIRYAEELEKHVIERTAEIETTRQRLDLAASAGGIGVWEVNLKDYTVFWDTRMHMIHGTGATDFDNSLDSWWKMLHPQDMKRSQTQFKNALQKTGLYMDEYRILLPDGSARYIAANAVVLYDEDQRPERMIGVNMDITQRKQVEETLNRANLEMERALRTKDEFLANMSHELRTPLNAILGISESLEEQFVGPLNERQLKYTGIIRESGRHLLELINDILDISKIEAGRMELELQNISVEKVCQSSLRMIKELAQKKGLNVSFEIKGGVKIILGDERRLKQSLVNLLGNAVKFTPRGGAIGLEVNSRPDANEATFTIWDKGVGIANEDIQYLFKPFVQLDSGLSREYQGTGLGLALVAQMIRLHGGSVQVESVLGQGSRFIITLPWTSEQQNARAKMTGELPQPNLKSGRKRKGKILIVEDTDVVITLMSEYLDFKGYKVLVAQNGMEGVQLAKQEHPDLILMDVMMPVMDGLEATRQIRLDSTLQNVPIIALTALAMRGDREICMAAGMNDYMSKPIRMQELADMIEKHLGAGGQPVQAG